MAKSTFALLLASILATLTFAATTTTSSAAAPTSTFCASSNQICGALNLPSSGSDTFFQIKATTSGGWAGMGIGSQMTGALIFIIYPDSSGKNVTVSPRLGTGHVEPTPDSDIKVSLLSGSGVDGDTMTANFKCSNCRSWNNNANSLDTSSSSAGFIWAIGPGTKIQSDDASLDSLTQHRVMGTANINAKAATGGNGGNPFDNSTSAATSSSSSSASTTGKSSTSGTSTSTASASASKTGNSSKSGGSETIAHSQVVALAGSIAMGVALLFMVRI